MGYQPYLQNVTRYGRTFQVVNPNHFVTPFYFMAASTTGVAGHVVKYDTQEDTIAIATSGSKAYEVAGFLMQDIKDLDAGPVKGYRNLNKTVENLGGNVGVLQGPGNVCFTKQYNGSPALGNRLTVAGDNSGNLAVYSTLMTSDPIAVVEATVSSVQPSIEPQQYSTTGGKNFIRIRTYNL